MFFGNVNRVRLAVRDRVTSTTPAPRAVVLDLTGSCRLSIPVLDELDQLREELARKDVAPHLAHVRSRAEQDLAQHTLTDHLGPHGRHRTVDDAVPAVAGGPV
ncbi:STAS domain-containing protein [Streptomyces sp. BE230]|uniref:STAS domain-containing protein n=1 Tax=Streptomyces sp. BE230 TaxID=3002526 RepID=UPI003FA6F9B0